MFSVLASLSLLVAETCVPCQQHCGVEEDSPLLPAPYHGIVSKTRERKETPEPMQGSPPSLPWLEVEGEQQKNP